MSDEAATTQYFDILPPQLAVHAMRSSGYRDTASAVAELIDNSIQAGEGVSNITTHIELLCLESLTTGGQRAVHRISEIAVYDNASGMDAHTLRGAMQFGHGTNLDASKQTHIGKFGMGLPNASISQCRRVEVYSWVGGECVYTYLDVDEIKGGEIREVPVPQKADVPLPWKKLIKSKIEDSGTLVIWKKIDRASWVRSKAFFNNAEFIIGRMYRHFLADAKVQIRFASFSNSGGTSFKSIEERYVRQNDPLMLMLGTMAPEPFDKKPAFVEWEKDTFEISHGTQKSEVTIRYTVSNNLKELEDEYKVVAGNTPIGKFVKKNEGISIVRAGRELELNTSWNLPSEPRERFWGVEVSFDPSLDDVFGVTNNKQSATKLKLMDLKEDAEQEELSEKEYLQYLAESGDPRSAIYMISTALQKRLSLLRKHIEKQRSGKNITDKGVPAHDAAEARASRATQARLEATGKQGQSDLNQDASEKDKQAAIEAAYVEAGVSPEDATRIAVASIQKKLRYVFTNAELASPAIFDVSEKAGELFIKINMNHPAYENFFDLLNSENQETVDTPTLTGLKLLLTAWARMEDEASERSLEQLQDIRIEWGKIARDFLR